jgi:16S rRNA (guanine527-N7)-methyltransferase
MHPARIAELLEPFLSPTPTPCQSEVLNPCPSESGQRPGEETAVLSSSQLQSISTYIDILLRWNARVNLTAIRDPEQIVTRHFGESLFAARHLFPVPSSVSSVSSVVKTFDSLADLGSGAGFPGLPIKLWAPDISLTLIESNHKKAAFLREVTRALTLTNVNIQNARAETLTTTFDLVTLRAVERFEAILPAAAALLAPAGRLALLISTPQQAQARSTLPHLVWSHPVPIPHSRSRILLLANRPDQAAEAEPNI